MFTNHGSSQDQIGAITDFMRTSSGNGILDANLKALSKLAAAEVVKITVNEDRKEFIRDVFNEHDIGYGEAVRLAFENEVIKDAQNIRSTDSRAPSKQYIAEQYKTSSAKLLSENAVVVSTNEGGSYQILTLSEDLSGDEFTELLGMLNEGQINELHSLIGDDIDLTILEMASDLDEMDEETMDLVVSTLTEEECLAVIDAAEYLDEDTELQNMLTEGLDEATAPAYKKNTSPTAAYRTARNTSRRASNTASRAQGKKNTAGIMKFAAKAAKGYDKVRHAAGAPGRAVRAGYAGTKSYGDSVKTGIKNAASNALHRTKTATRAGLEAAKNKTVGAAHSIWKGIKGAAKKVSGAIGRGIGRAAGRVGNYLSRQSRAAATHYKRNSPDRKANLSARATARKSTAAAMAKSAHNTQSNATVPLPVKPKRRKRPSSVNEGAFELSAADKAHNAQNKANREAAKARDAARIGTNALTPEQIEAARLVNIQKQSEEKKGKTDAVKAALDWRAQFAAPKAPKAPKVKKGA